MPRAARRRRPARPGSQRRRRDGSGRRCVQVARGRAGLSGRLARSSRTDEAIARTARQSPPSSQPMTLGHALTIRVVCGEDSYIAREGILRALEEEEDIEVIATCRDFDSLRMTVDDVVPDVVLADISMPPTNTDEGIRLAEELRTTHPDMGVVILSMYAEPVYATKLLGEGSDRRAYLLKDRVQYRSDLTRALREVASGRSVVDPRIVELLLVAQRKRADSHFDALTPREREILALVA